VVYLTKWKAVRVRQELVQEAKTEVERGQYKGLSEFVSEAIQKRLQTIAKERISEYLERDKRSRILYQTNTLLFTEKHIFAQATPQNTVKVGITDYFQDQLKEIVNIQTNKVGEKVSKDETLGVVETWWFTYDLFSPLNGKIVAVNKKIMDNPFILNADEYQWILEVEPKHKEVNSWMNGLLSHEEYNRLVTKLED